MIHSRIRTLPAVIVVAAVVCINPSRVVEAAQGSGVTWLIFVDDLHLDFVNTGHIRTFVHAIASELIRDGDAFVLRSSGPSPSIPFTMDRSLLAPAIRRLFGNTLLPSAILSPANEAQEEVRDRASVAGSAASDLLNAAEPSAPGRRVLLYVSNGYHLDPPDERIAGFADAARRSNVIVFAFNARALPDAPVVLVQGDAVRWDGYRAAMVNSLRAIAEPTGGFAVLDEAGFSDALQRIDHSVR